MIEARMQSRATHLQAVLALLPRRIHLEMLARKHQLKLMFRTLGVAFTSQQAAILVIYPNPASAVLRRRRSAEKGGEGEKRDAREKYTR